MFIFLDIDGVMVPAKSWSRPELLKDGFMAFSSKATAVLKNLISENTIVILTTSHKSNYDIDRWKQIFELRGIRISDLRKLPDNADNLNRRQEIEKWFLLNQEAVDEFIILDDDKSLCDSMEYIRERWIMPNATVGLTEEHLIKIQEIQQVAFID